MKNLPHCRQTNKYKNKDKNRQNSQYFRVNLTPVANQANQLVKCQLSASLRIRK